MSNDKSSKPGFNRNYDVVDPLGEIRTVAKELWEKAGEPTDKDWTDFFDEAEELLLSGRGKVKKDS